MKNSDKSCGVSSNEFMTQTHKVLLLEKSSEVLLNCSDIGTDSAELPLSAASSQIPKLEMFSKRTGNDYIDKCVDSVLEMDSKYSEADFFEEDAEDQRISTIRKVIRQELQRVKFCIHRVPCTKCGLTQIIGVRYSCLVCPGYNLCSDCEENYYHTHPLLKLNRPDFQVPRSGLSISYQTYLSIGHKK